MVLGQKKPDFENFLKVIHRDPTAKPALFEFFMCEEMYRKLAGYTPEDNSELAQLKLHIDAFAAAGYDYATVNGCSMAFPTKEHDSKATISLNDEVMITDRGSFENYPWPDPDAYDYSALEKVKEFLPEGMKLLVCGPKGILENVTSLLGYDNLCYLLYDDPELVKDVFDAVGSRFLRYYENSLKYDTVGVIFCNDDWGFNTQTFLSIEDMKKYVFPWHKKIAEAAHKAGRIAMLHSCGYMGDTIDYIVDDMKYDGKHSYEDNILCVEESYKRWGDRIAILGGMDLDFMIRSTPEEVKRRCKAMLELSKEKGGYALGTGNSIADYVPEENYFALLEAFQEYTAGIEYGVK